ncbi:hypothetical protein PV392_04115 [Streptomyces sp. ME03-5709C]|nr:hypothetical protein [Streptomyces sp. ME03-5709C]
MTQPPWWGPQQPDPNAWHHNQAQQAWRRPQGVPRPWPGGQSPVGPPPGPVNNPVDGPRPLSFLDSMIRKPTAAADTVVIFVNASNELIVSGSPGDKRGQEPLWRVYRSYYEVNMGRHALPVGGSVPSQGDHFHFLSEVDVHWQVADPVRVVREGLHDVRAALQPRLLGQIRTVTRRFDIERCADAEDAVNEALTRQPIGPELGLRTWCTVRLALDKASQEYLVTLRQREREYVTAASDYKVAAAKQHYDQQLTGSAAAFYAQYLQDGDVARFAVQLAKDPAQARQVIAAMNEQDRQQLGLKADMIKQLIDQGHLQPHDFEEPLDLAVEQLRQLLQGAPRRLPPETVTGPGPELPHPGAHPAPPPQAPPMPPRPPAGGGYGYPQ